MVWIHGGGYTLGYKSKFGNPAGLIETSQSNGKEGMIYVALNYRLGLFVWLPENFSSLLTASIRVSYLDQHSKCRGLPTPAFSTNGSH